jgi:hypothetical protein
MKQIVFLLVIVMPLWFACVNSNNNKTNAVEISAIDASIDSIPLIPADEIITFWNKFSEALLQNDTLILSDLIVDDIRIEGIYFRDGFSKITTMAFKNDTIISKSQFIKKFKQSLNPVYLRLLKNYNIREDIETPDYNCNEIIDKYNYFIETLYDDKYNTSGAFAMSYDIEGEPVENRGARSMILVFDKSDGERKLEVICYDYLNIDE